MAHMHGFGYIGRGVVDDDSPVLSSLLFGTDPFEDRRGEELTCHGEVDKSGAGDIHFLEKRVFP